MKKYLLTSSLIFTSISANAVDFNQCINDISNNVRETLKIDSDKSLNKSTRDWFCDDSSFYSYLKENKDADLSVILKKVPVEFKYEGTSEESKRQRRKYCQENQFKMDSRELYSTVRSVLSKDYVDALDVCVKGLEIVQNVKNPINVVLEPQSKSLVKLKMRATPRSFGELTPIVTSMEGNIDCPALPGRGVPLSKDFYEMVCKYNLNACEVGYMNVTTSTDKSVEGSFSAPKDGKQGDVIVRYDEPVNNWVYDERASVFGHTSGGNLECDDDGSYEGGHATGALSASVDQGRRISIKGVSISCSGGASFTCSSSSQPVSARQIQAHIQHHSCAGSPRFTMSYNIEKLIEENQAKESRITSITAGSSTAVVIPANAKNVVVEITKENGETVVVGNLDEQGATNAFQGFSAYRTSTGVTVHSSDDCL
ncbi:hypothetical protein ACMXYN_05655 [Neptuniibacter sp. PT8_73]|uniref:hypothetical protein n=1 Tax=Neptuniibacter sp. PT8_73 TaxID=3398206 RepID=UPI0039F5126B